MQHKYSPFLTINAQAAMTSEQKAGFKNVQWNATNDQGKPVPAGVYIYTIQAGEFRQTKKMILLK